MTRYGLLALTLVLTLGSTPAWAQHKAEITPFIGYQFGGSIQTFNGDLKIEADMNYGATLDITLRRGSQIELGYNRQDTNLKFVPFLGSIEKVPMSVEYFQIGGLGYVERGAAQPFAKFTLGVTHYNPDARNIGGRTIDDEWRFSVALGAGVKTFPSQRVGLRLEGNLLGTFLDSGGGIWCGGGGGCSLGLFGTGILQGNVQAGLAIAF